MKKNYFMMMAMAFSLAFAPCLYSCSEEDDGGTTQNPGGDGDDDDTPGGGDNEPGIPSKEYLSMAESLQLLEQQGVEVVNKLAPIQNEKALIALNTLEELLGLDDEYDEPVVDVDTAVNIRMHARSEDIVNDFWDFVDVSAGEVGTYTWNSEEEEFSFKRGESLVFNYPSTPDGETNNATLEVNGANKGGGLPTDASAVLKVDGAVAMTAVANAAYDASGMPKSAETNLAIGSNYTTNTQFSVTKQGLEASSYVKVGSDKLATLLLLIDGFSFSQGMNAEAMLASIEGVQLKGQVNDRIYLRGSIEQASEFIGAVMQLDAEYEAKDSLLHQEIDELYARMEPLWKQNSALDSLLREYDYQIEELNWERGQLFSDSSLTENELTERLEAIDAEWMALDRQREDVYAQQRAIDEKIRELQPELNLAWQRYDEEEERLEAEIMRKEVELYNKHVKLTMFATEGLIGNIEYYPEEDSDGDTEMNARIIFGDGSKVACDKFFDEDNFPRLTSMLEMIIDSFDSMF